MTCRPSLLVVLAVLLVAGALLTMLLQGPAVAPPIAAPPPGPSPGAGFAPVVASALPSVVQIRSSRGLGSGVVLDAAGNVVTNAHVVAGAHSFRVTLADGSQDSATLRGVFAQGDLAVVRLTQRGRTPRRSPTPPAFASATTPWRSATRSDCARA